MCFRTSSLNNLVLTCSGESIRYAEAIFDQFGEVFLSNLLRNLGEARLANNPTRRFGFYSRGNLEYRYNSFHRRRCV